VDKVRQFASQGYALWKGVASIFKQVWTIDDYPIRVRFQRPSELPNESRLKLIPWIADVVNWPAMSGHGNTRKEALEAIRKNFDRFKATKASLPRPGTKVPIEFAASERVDQHAELAKDFIKRILDLETAWISDESSLSDFHGNETNELLTDRILRVYGVHVSDIPSGKLADIFDKILKHRVDSPIPN
jgi:hypothetical protein